MSRSPRRLRYALIGGVAVAAGLASGLVVAQPVQGTLPSDTSAGVATEEAPPPATVLAPTPQSVPPVDDKEVQPAEAPKAQVVEKAVQQPVRRDRLDVAILQALDKVTAETIRFEAPVGRAVRWKGLIFTVRACEKSAADEPIADNIAYLTVFSQPRPQPGKLTPPPRQTFRGWMYASSPGLNPMEHASYDAWVISCKASAPPPPPAPAVARPVAAEPKPEPEDEAEAPAAETPAPEVAPAPKTEPIA
jgi:hypothetical protein